MRKNFGPNPLKPALTVQALPTAANAQAIFTVTGIHDLTFLIAAKRTFHGDNTPFQHFLFIISHYNSIFPECPASFSRGHTALCP